MRGISPIISTVIVIAIVFGSATLISPWMLNLVTDVANKTGSTASTTLLCQDLAYDFDSQFETDGVSWNFTGVTDTLETKITNTGDVNINDFSFEITIWNETTGMKILRFNPTTATQITAANTLSPGQSVILDAYITEDVKGNLREIKILNRVCPSVYAYNPNI